MALKARDAPTCIRCRKSVKHPFWCCITCEDISFICLECNKAIEEAKPWQWEYRPVSDPEDKHNWAHPLVLINGDQAPATQTLEERFTEENAKVHDRLNGIEASLSQSVNRLNGIEGLLSQILATIVKQ
ncbi:hypothetical protein BU17DRAFT_98209 [Hysterangium stoloniferum]|nr:hypothetical protein BU17DRAFT_98209 [Hysterangium stoloniferum]